MTATGDYVRQLEDALEVLWGELPIPEVRRLRHEMPELSDFLCHMHERMEQVTVDQSWLGRWLWQVVCVCGMDGAELPSLRLARAAGERHAAGKERGTTRRAA